jgi:hypothetical protein
MQLLYWQTRDYELLASDCFQVEIEKKEEMLCCMGTCPPPKNARPLRFGVLETLKRLGNVPDLAGTSSGTWGRPSRSQSIPHSKRGLLGYGSAIPRKDRGRPSLDPTRI